MKNTLKQELPYRAQGNVALDNSSIKFHVDHMIDFSEAEHELPYRAQVKVVLDNSSIKFHVDHMIDFSEAEYENRESCLKKVGNEMDEFLNIVATYITQDNTYITQDKWICMTMEVSFRKRKKMADSYVGHDILPMSICKFTPKEIKLSLTDVMRSAFIQLAHMIRNYPAEGKPYHKIQIAYKRLEDQVYHWAFKGPRLKNQLIQLSRAGKLTIQQLYPFMLNLELEIKEFLSVCSTLKLELEKEGWGEK